MIKVCSNKNCSFGGIPQILKSFSKNKHTKDGYRYLCKDCEKNRQKRWYEKNKEKVIARTTVYQRTHKEQTKKYDQTYRKKNKSAIKELWKKYYDDHRGERKQYNKEYKENHKEALNQYRKEHRRKFNEYERQRKQEDPCFKLACNLRNRIYCAVKYNSKVGSAVRDLGCSIQELKQRFETMFYPNPKTDESMSWDNHGIFGWHIDHVKPLVSFDLTDRKQFLEACHYTNLRPLWAIQNLSEGSRGFSR